MYLDYIIKGGEKKVKNLFKPMTRTGMVIVAVLTVAGLAAATSLLTQTFPLAQNGANLTSVCASGKLVPTSGDGFATFTCGGTPALYVGTTASFTPTFNLTGTNYTDLYVYTDSPLTTGPCSSATGAMQLSNGTSVTLTGDGAGYDYCADFVSGALVGGSFIISWN